MKKILKDLRLGIHYHYPICCIVHYCIDRLRGKLPGRERCKILRRNDNSFYIPCIIHSFNNSCITILDEDLNLIDISRYI